MHMPKKTLGFLFCFLVSTASWATRPPIDDVPETTGNVLPNSELILRVLDIKHKESALKSNPNIVFLKKPDFSQQFKRHLDELIADYEYTSGGSGQNYVYGSASNDKVEGTDHYRTFVTTVDATFEKRRWFSTKAIEKKEFVYSGLIVVSDRDRNSEVDNSSVSREKEILDQASSTDVRWYLYDGNLYINAIGEREMLTERLLTLKSETEEYRKQMIDTLNLEIPKIQQKLEDLKFAVVEEQVPHQERGVSLEELAKRYIVIQDKADSFVGELKQFYYGKSLSEILAKIQERELLVAQVQKRLDQLGEPGMRLTE